MLSKEVSTVYITNPDEEKKPKRVTGEINWSLGTYVPVKQIEKAFSVSGLPRPGPLVLRKRERAEVDRLASRWPRTVERRCPQTPCRHGRRDDGEAAAPVRSVHGGDIRASPGTDTVVLGVFGERRASLGGKMR